MFDHAQVRNRNLQCVRGIAILLVVIAHILVLYTQNNIINNFFNFTIGVDLFFVISGYLMGLTFIAKIKTIITLKDTTNFYYKRIKRLFNTNVFWSLFAVSFCLLLGKVGDLSAREFSVWLFLSNVTFLSNIFNIFYSGYFGYFWTLGTEVQFYLMLPLLLFIFRKNFVAGIFGVLFVLTFLNPIPIDIQWLFRWNSLFIGVLIWKVMAWDRFKSFYNHLILWPNSYRIFVMIFLVGLMAFFAHLSSVEWAMKATVIGISFGIVLILFLSSERVIFGKISWLIEWFGDISYSWYLCHIPTWFFTSYAIDRMGFGLIPFVKYSICVLVSILFAALSYRYIENSGRSKIVIQ